MTENKKLTIITAGAAALYLYQIAAFGFVLSKVWAWVAVPTLGMPAINLTEWMALMVLAKTIRAAVKGIPARPRGGVFPSLEDFLKRACAVVLMPWMSLGLAWLAFTILL